MGKLALILMLISLMGPMNWAQTIQENIWAQKLETVKETVTNLQFYFHDTLSGNNPSAIKVVKETEKSPTLFGAILMVDDPLTEGPEPTSKLIGRAQGLYGSAGQQELSLIMAMNFEFIDGMFSGSSISIFGKNPAIHPVREMPIVGGTGLFRLARGHALASTHWLDITTGDAIVQYNVTVIH